MDTVTVERKKLYQQVWSIPGQQLAIMYGISDVGLAKACKRYDIPRPPRGYWARLAVGQKVRRPLLPSRGTDYDKVHFSGWNMPENSMQNAVKKNRLISTPALGGELHPAAAIVRGALVSASESADGLLAVADLDVRISIGLRDRCVSVVDSLAKRWGSRDGIATIEGDVGGGIKRLRLAIGPDYVGVQIAEKVDESKPVTDTTRLTGNLCLTITGNDRKEFRRRWSDTKSQRLERMLGQLVETIINVITLVRDERVDRECVARQQEKVHRIRERSEGDASEEFYRRQEFSQKVDRWHEADRMRKYLNALASAVSSGQVMPKNADEFAEWFGWATRYADSVDPISTGQLPEERAIARENVTVDKLDLTVSTRRTVSMLAVADTDALSKLKQDVVREACKGNFGRTWNEISRVLEIQGYDGSKREEASEWW